MRWFFDSSVLVPALLPDHVHHVRSFAAFVAASPRNAACAAHSLAEVYATLTRYPGKQRLSAEAAALLVQEIEYRLALVWLDSGEYRAAIRRIATLGIVGGAVYDGLVAACALKAEPSESSEAPATALKTTLDPAKDTWVVDHCPSYVIPSLPMMSVLDLFAQAATGAAAPAKAVEITDLRLLRWIVVDLPTQLRVVIEPTSRDALRAVWTYGEMRPERSSRAGRRTRMP